MLDLVAWTLENVSSALFVELPHADRGELRERAESLVAIAEKARVPVEELLQWIHADAQEKEYSLREWRAYCAQRPPSQPTLFASSDSDASAFDPK